MIIKEFLIIQESGVVIFHRRFIQTNNGKTTDIILRSGLISALYNYTTEVEQDSLDFIKMEKVTLFFKKRHDLLFVLFLESSLKPEWCENDFDEVLNRFFELFPELIWQQEVVDTRVFEAFIPYADLIINKLAKKLELLSFLIEENLLTEDEYSSDDDIETLGEKIGFRILNKNYDIFQELISKGDNLEIMERFEHILLVLMADHIKRIKTSRFILDCSKCFMCGESSNIGSNCFYKGILDTIANNLDQEIEIVFLQRNKPVFQLL
ncbi:MAG: hypothetical protein ACTSW1_09520 [Candidatus Hodarchaeales archaeon]